MSDTRRERVAKAIFARRWQLDDCSVDSMFAWYAENQRGTDRSRMAIYGAFRDADAALAAIEQEMENAN